MMIESPYSTGVNPPECGRIGGETDGPESAGNALDPALTPDVAEAGMNDSNARPQAVEPNARPALADALYELRTCATSLNTAMTEDGFEAAIALVQRQTEIGAAEKGGSLAEMQQEYLLARGLTIDLVPGDFGRLMSQAEYVLREALEMRDAVRDLVVVAQQPRLVLDHLWLQVERELADVVLAGTLLARMLPGSVSIEGCIAEKTEADRGRG